MQSIPLIPDTVSVQYSELMRQAIHPAPDGANLSFKSKTIKGKKYWYLYISLGRRRSEHYLGHDTAEVRKRIEQEKALWESTTDDREVRARLVAMLVAGGASATPAHEGKVLALLEKSGVFLSGGVIVGTLAFRAFSNMLGVRWLSDQQTHDIDIASDNTFRLAVRPDTPKMALSEILLNSGMGFVEVPALNRKSASTEFKIKGHTLSVELLTPMGKKNSATPVMIKTLGTHAEPVRYLDYLLDDIQPAVLLYRHGVLVNVPSPARFAIHKLVVSQRRPAAMQEKSRRDLSQAEQCLSVLLEHRPFDISEAAEAARAMGDKFNQQLDRGLKQLHHQLQSNLESHF